jgi:hypothetical protein
VRWHREGLYSRDLDRFIEPNWYCFVNERHFGGRDLHRRIEPSIRNVTIVNTTQNITNYTVINNRIVNPGVPVDQVERVTGQRVPRRRIVDASSAATGRGNKLSENDLALYRPKLEDRAPARTPPTADLRPGKVQDKEARRLEAQQTQEKLRQTEQLKATKQLQLEKQQRKAEQQKAADQLQLEKQQRKAEQFKAQQQLQVEKQQRKTDQQKLHQQQDQQRRIDKQQRKTDQQRVDQQRKQEKQQRKQKNNSAGGQPSS